MSEGEKILKILVVSDIHGHVEKVHELTSWLGSHGCPLIDFVLCAGDIGQMKPEDASVPEIVYECEAQMSAVLTALESVSVNVLYIGGNHDSPTVFDESKKKTLSLSVHSQNIHTRIMKLASGLVVSGLGGSTPASQGTNVVNWSAFPYKDDQMLANELRKIGLFFGTSSVTKTETATKKNNQIYEGKPIEITANEVETDDSLILLCHQGPSLSCTSIDSVENPPIHSGSRTLSSLIISQEQQDNLIMFIHGHTHHGNGICNVGKVPVLNPGCLRDGKFSIITLTKRVDQIHWIVSSCELITL